MEDRRSNSVVLVAIVLLVLALPALYVLSIGPAAAYYEHREVPPAVAAFYAPLEWIADSSQPLGRALIRYVEMWTGE